MKQIFRILTLMLLGLCLFDAAPLATQNATKENDITVSKVEIHKIDNAFEVVLNTQEPYDKSPQLSEDTHHKGVILPFLLATSHNETFQNAFISEIQVFNMQNQLYVIAVGEPKDILANVSKSKSALKITFSKANSTASLNTLTNTNQAQIPTIDASIDSIIKPSSNELAFKSDLDINMWRYLAVLFVMMALVFGLWAFKRFVIDKKSFSSILGAIKDLENSRVEIISQRHIDTKHKIITLESNGYRYLILIGAGCALLIDKYHIVSSKIDTKEQFSALLEKKQERIAKYKNKVD